MRNIKELPKTFRRAKVEYEHLVNVFWSQRLGENNQRIETKENIGLMFLLVQDFLRFSEFQFENIGNKILEIFEKENTDTIYLYEFGKVIRFDKEAQWFITEDISESEWRKYDLECSRNYAETRLERKNNE